MITCMVSDSWWFIAVMLVKVVDINVDATKAWNVVLECASISWVNRLVVVDRC